MTASDSDATAPRSRTELALIAALVAALVLLAIKCAWVCDDAYITFRVVDNFVHGHGLRWNADERVQAYTNPLWMFVMSGAYSLSGEAYFTAILLGVATTLVAAVMLSFHVARETAGAVLALLALASSKAFVDFSTSGLENPLLHVALIGAFLAARKRDAPLTLALWCSATALTRLDGLVLLAPLLLELVLRERNLRTLARLAAGFAPLFAWEAFSLVYYGALTPNTAIAKLNTGLPATELAEQGLSYLVDSLSRDPITLVAIAGAVAICIAARERLLLALAAGMALHLLYVVEVGGDFMSGRFLTAPLCCAAIVFAHVSWPRSIAAIGAFLALAAMLFTPLSPLRAPLDASRGKPPGEHVSDRGIADERAYWYAASGLFSPNRELPAPPYRHISRGHKLAFRLRDEHSAPIPVEGIGYLGFWTGPTVHLVDPMGLSDGFLARLPIVVNGAVVRPDKNSFRGRPWRIGHFYRDTPEGYLESLSDPSQRLADPELEALRVDVELITRAPLWSSERWRAIFRRLR